ncbi:RNA exonuclease 5 [Agrilus planipennis]|uniref:RNA exonuclease 5 n=1 Tax=Agrilus planipennis TaxID=224129 RepID=A0A1W4X9I9_AGRPL|nr:RNA exonuclease 5 [Agrilus planipennis]
MPLLFLDIQHLLLYCLLGHHSPYSPARWCQLERFPKIQQTNVLIIDNISLYHYHAYESCFPFLSGSFQHKLEVVAPFAYKGDIVTDLLMVPLTTTQVRKYVTEFGTLEDAVVKSGEVYDQIKDLFPLHENISKAVDGLPATDKFPRTHLLLSGWQMVEENFPLPIKGLMETKYTGYVLTKDEYKDVTPFSPMFGLDCEMCRTTTGDLELTRISIVDEDHKVFYEELVKPDNRIVDYLTQFSGITPKMMKNVTKKLQDVQKDLRNLLPPDAILVGQSLGNDLHALKMMHPYVIDSSVIFNLTGDRTRKSKLQLLAREFLFQHIQQGRGGHCSIEDSKASLELVQLKLQNDIFFGDAVLNGLSAQKHPQLGHPYFATSFFKQIARANKPVSVISLPDVAKRYKFFLNKGNNNVDDQSKVTIYSSECNETVIQDCIEKGPNASMNIAHLQVNQNDLEKEPETILRQLDTWIKNCYEATFAPSLSFVIFGGQRETGNGSCFIKMKNLF